MVAQPYWQKRHLCVMGVTGPATNGKAFSLRGFARHSSAERLQHISFSAVRPDVRFTTSEHFLMSPSAIC
jgi:hypothetical protein